MLVIDGQDFATSANHAMIQGDPKRQHIECFFDGTNFFQKCTNPMIFGKHILGGFGILMSNMSQVQNILLFQGCDKIVLRLHTAGTESPDTPKHI